MSMSTLPTSREFVTQLLGSLTLQSCHDAGAHPLDDAPESVKKLLLSLQVLFPNDLLPALDLLDRKLVTRFRIGSREPLSTAGAEAEIARSAACSAADKQGTVQAAGQPTGHSTGHVLREESATDTPDAIATHPPLLPTQAHPGDGDTIYYVHSAQQRSSRYSTSYESTTSYEVRLQAWNCTCPAFAFAAFPSVHPEPPIPAFTTPLPTLLPNQPPYEESLEADKKTAGCVFGGLSLGEGVPPVCKHLLACVLAERCTMFENYVEERRVSPETAAGWAAGWGDS